jgi:hypothetical protein
MHQVNLGLWAHLLQAVFFDLKTFLEAAKRPTGTSFFGPEKQTAVWNRYNVTLYDIVFMVFAELDF